MPNRVSQDDGNGKRWTTPEQTAWLETQRPAFINSRPGSGNSRPAFWAKVYQDWSARWPVAAAPSSLGPQADAVEVQAPTEEELKAIRTLKAVCAYCCSVIQS